MAGGAVRTGRAREWRLWDYIELYRRNGIGVLPGRPGEKHPYISGREVYYERPPTEEELEEWFKDKEIGEVNVFILLGPVSNGLVALDFDGEAVYGEFKRRLGELDETTFYAVMGSWIVRTARGYHVYLRVEELDKIVERYGGKYKLEAVLRAGGEKGRAEVFMGREITAPPSLHPSGGRYRFYSPQLEDEVLTGERGIVTLMREQFEAVLEALGIKPPGEGRGGTSAGGVPARIPGEWRRLGEGERQDLFNLLLPVFRRMDGRRHSFVPSLAGYCAKKGVHPEDCAGIVARLYDAVGRRDREHLPAVQRTYERYMSGEPVAAVEAPAGDVVRGLRPELRDVLGEDEAERFLRELEQLLVHGSPGRVGRSRLSEADISGIVQALRDYWAPDYADELARALAEWASVQHVNIDAVVEVARRLDEMTGGDFEGHARIIEEMYRARRDGDCGGCTGGPVGLVSVLEEVIRRQNPGLSGEDARDTAVAVVAKLEKILGPRRTLFVATPYKPDVLLVNDPRRGMLFLERRTDRSGGAVARREYIADWYIREVVVSKSGNMYRYAILFGNARTGEEHRLTGDIPEIARELRRIHGVKQANRLEDALSGIVSEMVRRGVAVVRREAEIAGIIPRSDGGVKLEYNGMLSILKAPVKPDLEKAKAAYMRLRELRKHYDPAKFDVALSWAGYAPMGYALKKQYHNKQVYLLLYGERHTGKTTLARIIKSLYPAVDPETGEEIGEESGTEYRLGHVLDRTTLPILYDEARKRLSLAGMRDLLARAAVSEIARWRGDTGKRYHARAALAMTSNYPSELIMDPALHERIITLEFTMKDYVYSKPRGEQEDFRRKYDEYRRYAPHLGAVLLQVIVEKWGEISSTWAYSLLEKRDYLKLGQWVWVKTAEKLGVEPPEWAVGEAVLDEERPEQREEEMLWEVLHDAVREAMLRARVEVIGSTLAERLRELYEKGMLPGWIHVRTSDVILTDGLKVELARRFGYSPIGGLKGIAGRLGYEYGPRKTTGGRSVKGIIIPIKEFEENLETPEETVERLAAKYARDIAEGSISLPALEERLKEEDGIPPEEARDIAVKLFRNNISETYG